MQYLNIDGALCIGQHDCAIKKKRKWQWFQLVMEENHTTLLLQFKETKTTA